jgi:hypothetical protein
MTVAGNPVARVVVTREGSGWLAEVPELRALRRARSLCTLDRLVRQLLGRGQALELASGFSRRDLGVLLELSHQRVQQLLQRAD